MTIKILQLLVSFSFAILFSQEYTAKVIKIKDGDTIEILLDGQPQTIRLAHIDCPEKKQPFGSKAKQFVSDKCFGKMVTVVIAGKPDRNGRWIAEIFINHQNINKELVRNGLAWHFKKYSKDSVYAELENIAREKKIGLWQDNNPIAPWEWRKSKRGYLTFKTAS
ncbi:MAG: thermonuclease family protein [Bacteroidetes bacterium]|jgi:endonuclease YncB( thermonuclease family)|nr:thermonuclease family protein [Bacteroidota bacterium]